MTPPSIIKTLGFSGQNGTRARVSYYKEAKKSTFLRPEIKKKEVRKKVTLGENQKKCEKKVAGFRAKKLETILWAGFFGQAPA